MEDFKFNKVDYLVLYRTVLIGACFLLVSSIFFYF